jgi:hypothetical protein
MQQIQKAKRHRGSDSGRQEPLAIDPRDPDVVRAHRERARQDLAARASRPGPAPSRAVAGQPDGGARVGRHPEVDMPVVEPPQAAAPRRRRARDAREVPAGREP